MWILKRLAELGVSIDNLLLAYTSRVRVHLEANAALWSTSISQLLRKKLESVQKACLYIVLGRHATTDYYCNLAMLNLEPMADRREKLFRKFARTTFKHPEHRKMFTIDKGNTRSGRRVIEPNAKSARYRKSAIPSLARTLNSM